ncbi:MAG TPA: copper oxidase [Acidobacteriota bacterium]|nr:copper oxidase [Acidobacteriota bacterium]
MSTQEQRFHWARLWRTVLFVLLTTVFLPVSVQAQVGTPGGESCQRQISAHVVAFDKVFFWNRLGAMQPQGMMYALARDVFPVGADQSVPTNSCAHVQCQEGRVDLRETKRPRPLVLRMNEGDCLHIRFQNLLDPVRRDDEQVATRDASIHVVGLQLVTSIADDGSRVGTNGNAGNGVVPPGGTARYVLFAEKEGQHVFYSSGATTTGEGDGGQMNAGLFGAVNVEPRGTNWIRSQVTARDMRIATIARTPQGQPILDFNKVYPNGHPQAGRPVFQMLQAGRIVHSDLTAIIEGPFKARKNPVYPDRGRSFREFTIMYHDEIGAVQAFDIFEDPILQHTLHSVRDAFAINYGTGGIGAEILANRFDVGPMRDCVGCKYEEFFLSSWTVGDPAMVVDTPANACVGDPNCRANEALYPADPSNVYHAYLRDHVKFRILHGGSKEHHIHHQHTHQWLYAPDSDNSAYLDSQAIGPGSSFTLEMTYNGSGNRNAAVGDSIFHCHFYPHFAQGMWALWRVHDVFEDGTRRLPDGEIERGTPIPGLVPIPGQPMAPAPGARVTVAPDPRLPNRGGQVQINGTFVRDLTPADIPGLGNPGYPFWVPGAAGSRAPHPPLDTIDDGGLPRHILLEGEALHIETRLDFTKELERVEALEIDENGHPVEEVAMRFHEQRRHSTFLTDGSPSQFIANGLPRQHGAPYAEPCMLECRVGGPLYPECLEKGFQLGDAIPQIEHFDTQQMQEVPFPREYKAADIQLDVIYNKAGWHYPQLRMISLWGDVVDTFDGVRPPEPLFFRANSGDCISYYLTNLVPNIYELDDFQVRTPTDILGQHIHLVKFDVLASDGAANGWNYEDGSFSPDEVRERIHAIRAHNGCHGDEFGGDPRDGTFVCPVAQPHPFFDDKLQDRRFWGAQTTVQRWYADDVLNLAGDDRTLRTVFTHDHFGPSTHQQAGLYAGLVVEPETSKWRDPVTGVILGSRFDGGPTSWRADILAGPEDQDSYREFLLEFADFGLAYQDDSHANLDQGQGPTFPNEWAGLPDGQQPGMCNGIGVPGLGFDCFEFSINPPGKKEVGLPFLLAKVDNCPVTAEGLAILEEMGLDPPEPPCPEAVSAEEPGTMVVNYRNEPLALRTRDPLTNQQAGGDAGDLALAFSSRVNRADARFNVQPNFYPPLTGGVRPRDPFTPLMQVLEADRVQIRTLVGAHEEGHNFSVNGIKWLFEPSWTDSGYRNSQMMGISEHFEMIVPQLVKNPVQAHADHLYAAGSSSDDLWNGLWGLIRVSRAQNSDILPLPNNPAGRKEVAEGEQGRFNGVCPKSAPVRGFKVVAALARDILGGPLIYNRRPGNQNWGPLRDPHAIMYVRASDLDANGKLLSHLEPEPLILRANAGDCIEVKLENRLPNHPPDQDGFFTLPMIVENFNANQIRPSNKVGLHPQLVFYDVSRDDGNNVGINQIQTADPGHTVSYRWYAGDIFINDDGTVDNPPIEFGAINLIPADRIKQPHKGAIGALLIEPEGAQWREDADRSTCGQHGQPRCSRAAATVRTPEGVFFREFTLIYQSDVNLRCDGCGNAEDGDANAVPNLAESEDPEDSAQKAFNYRTEPMWFRFGFRPDAPLTETRDLVITDILTNGQVGGDPETPLFYARAGDDVRFRVLKPAGNQRNHVFQVHGHIWQQEPYVNDSTELGFNALSLWEGAKMGHGPTNHFDALLINGAGGEFGIKGDYLYRDQPSFLFDGGLWGLMRVLGPRTSPISLTEDEF